MESNEKQFKLCMQLAENYCIQREYCHSEIKDKLKKHGYDNAIIEMTLNNLQQNNFINEERYASAYVHDKFKLKKWGKMKIKQMLRNKKIPESVIEKALLSVDQTEYKKMIEKIISQKSDTLTEKNFLRRKQKLIAYALSKGYEKSIVWEVLNEWMNSQETS